MKNEAKSVPASAANPANAVAHGNSIDPAGPLNRPLVDGEDHPFSRFQRHNLHPRLHPRALLGEDELAAGKVLRVAQEKSSLQREHPLAVQVLVEAIVVAWPVTEDQRRRARLAGGMTSFKELGMVLGKRPGVRCPSPGIGGREQPIVEGGPKRLDQIRQRVSEIAIFASPEAMPGHRDRASEGMIVIVG